MYDIVTEHEQCKCIVDNCGWGGIFKINDMPCDKKLTDANVERWWESTDTFHFSNFEIGFTPHDFTSLTSILVGRGNDPLFTSWEEDEMEYCLTMASGYLGNAIGINVDSVNDTNGWMVGIPEDLENIGTYDWGSAILAQLYQSLGEISSGRVSTFNGMWLILPYWFYFYFHSLAPIIEKRKPNSNDYEPIDLGRFLQIMVFNKDQLAKDRRETRQHSKQEDHR